MADPGRSKFSSRVQQQAASFIRSIERIHEEENELYAVRADNISRENDRLRKELYDLQQRINILTERLGFENLDRAEETLNEKLVGIVQEHKAAVAKISDLASELESAKNQLSHEQASRAEEQQLLESLRADHARRKQSSLEAQAESELNREALGRLKLELQAEWQKTSKLESTISSLRKENERLASELEGLAPALAKGRAQRSSMGPETPLRGPTDISAGGIDAVVLENQGHLDAVADTSSLPLEAQVAHLRRQYDELLASKLRLSEKYSNDLAEWKTFKEQYRTASGGKGIFLSEDGIKTRRRVLRQAKDSPTPVKRTSNVQPAPLNPFTVATDGTRIKEESPPPVVMPPLHPRPNSPRQENPSPAVSNTDTQDSQAPSPAEQAANKAIAANTLSVKRTANGSSTRPDIAIIKQGSQSDGEGNLLLRKLNNTTISLTRSLSSPVESPRLLKEAPRRPKPLGKRKAFVFDEENESSEEEVPSRTLGSLPPRSRPDGDGESREERDARLRALRRKSGPQILAEYQQYKGRGRYATGLSKTTDKAINAEFEINPAQNEGMAFEFDSVVRDKNERKKLAAGDCIACKEYYEAVGAMPTRAGAPLWRSPPPKGAGPSRPHACKHHKATEASPPEPNNDAAADSGADLTAHKQEISRHRHRWAPASTPPDYWNIGFPDTQQVEEINRRAGELHNQKRNAIEEEAR